MSKFKSWLRALGITAAFAGSAILGAPAFAATATTTFAVNATVLASCVVAATNLNFGNYTSTSASPNDATNTVTATCTPTTAYTIAADGGISGDMTARTMLNGATALNYAMYADSARTNIWGDGTGSTVTLSGTGSGVLQSYTVYGRVPVAQNVGAGLYTDLITVTLSY